MVVVTNGKKNFSKWDHVSINRSFRLSLLKAFKMWREWCRSSIKYKSSWLNIKIDEVRYLRMRIMQYKTVIDIIILIFLQFPYNLRMGIVKKIDVHKFPILPVKYLYSHSLLTSVLFSSTGRQKENKRIRYQAILNNDITKTKASFCLSILSQTQSYHILFYIILLQ